MIAFCLHGKKNLILELSVQLKGQFLPQNGEKIEKMQNKNKSAPGNIFFFEKLTLVITSKI